jgi:hypothetical protein
MQQMLSYDKILMMANAEYSILRSIVYANFSFEPVNDCRGLNLSFVALWLPPYPL